MNIFRSRSRSPEKSDGPNKPQKVAALNLSIGDEVPNFTAESTVGALTYHDMIDGVWSLLVTFPPGPTAVATTEIGMISKLMPELEARNVRVFGLSCNTVEELREWAPQIEELEDTKVAFPLIADPDARVSAALGLVRHDSAAADARRSLTPATLVVLTDIDMRVRATTLHPDKVGRNFYEVIRTFDALQQALFHQTATPANWVHGSDVLVNSKLSSNAARSIFPKGVIETRPWFRQTPNPD